MGIDGYQNIPSPQDLLSQIIRTMPYSIGTSGQHGYTSQTMYNILKGNDNTGNDTMISITQTAAAATAGTTATSAGMSGITTTT